MSTVSDVIAFHFRPRQIVRKRLLETSGEGHALMYLVAACLLFYMAQLPEMVRQDLLSTSSAPLNAVAAARFLGGAILAPLFFYILAAFIGLIFRLFGVSLPWFHTRIALFWPLLAIAPASLIVGILRGLVPSATILWFASVFVAVGFVIFWVVCLMEAVLLWRELT